MSIGLLSSLAYPVPIYLPRKKRIISPAEWLRDKLREREAERKSTITNAIAFDANIGSATNTATLSAANDVAINSRIFIAVGWFDSPTLTGISGGGLTWVVDHQYQNAGANIGIATADCPGGLSETTNITAQFSGTVGFRGLCGFSFTGVATGSSGYVNATATGRGINFNNNWDTNNIVTTEANTLLIGISGAAENLTDTPGGSWTEVHDFVWEGTNVMTVVYQIVSSSGTYEASGSWSGSPAYELNLGLAYEEAATTQFFRPDADTDAAGWTTTPLHSKLSDEADGTFVTDGLA